MAIAFIPSCLWKIFFVKRTCRRYIYFWMVCVQENSLRSKLEDFHSKPVFFPEEKVNKHVKLVLSLFLFLTISISNVFYFYFYFYFYFDYIFRSSEELNETAYTVADQWESLSNKGKI
jgi:hypothetical protein